MSEERRRRSGRSTPGGLDLNPRHSRQRRGRTRSLPTSRTPRPRRSPLRGLGLNLAATLRLAVLGIELGALALLLTSPVFKTHDIQVSGTSHLTRAEVLARAGLGLGGIPSSCWTPSRRRTGWPRTRGC